MAYGRNLTNHTYFTQETAQVVGAFISAGGTTAAGGENGAYAPPRTFGIVGSYTF
jgi:hypothetical protein